MPRNPEKIKRSELRQNHVLNAGAEAKGTSEDSRKQVLVIGAGASGLVAGISAARNGASVTILEANDKPGRKLLVTGNGRCNLTNMAITREHLQTHVWTQSQISGDSGDGSKFAPYRTSGNTAFWQKVLSDFDANDTIEFFGQLGLLTQERNGGVYPLTDQAATVLEILLMEAHRLKIKCKYREKAEQISQCGDRWRVRTATWTYEADALILACGSCAAPATGASESGYQLAKSLGHKICPVFPALVPLTVKESWVKKLAGLRCRAVVTLIIEGDSFLAEQNATQNPGDLYFNQKEKHYQESGELQWTEYGISGIVVFQLARRALEGLGYKQRVTAEVDCIPSLKETELYDLLCEREIGETAGELFAGILPVKLSAVLLELCGVRNSVPRREITREKIRQLAHTCKHLSLTITGGKSFEMAQACAGGVDTSEVNPDTMESRLYPRLYFAGELLDVDGVCGGYNLQWAWASGYTAGVSAAANDNGSTKCGTIHGFLTDKS